MISRFRSSTEHEVTRLTALVAAIARKLDVQSEVDSELAEIEQDVAPEAVLDAIEAGERSGTVPTEGTDPTHLPLFRRFSR